MKNIIREYFTAFRWRRIKEGYRGSNWWFFIYMLVVVPMIFTGGISESWQNVLAFYSLIVPIMFHLFTVPLHPFSLPKMMYLCPMTKDERRAYLKRTYSVKVLFSFLAALLGAVGLMAAGGYDIFLTVIAFVLSILIIFATSLQTRAVGNGADWSKSKDRWETVTLIFFLLQAVVLASEVATKEICSPTEKIVYLGILLFIDLPLTLKILSFWNETVERMMYYEKRV